MRDFRELKVWQKAHHVALEVYRQSRSFPVEARFGLTAHLRKPRGQSSSSSTR
jgi:hypothetical protein